MKKKASLFIAALMLWQLAAEAALPPLAQTRKEILAIVSDERLLELLSMADVIEEIKKVDNGYQVTTQHDQMFVEVVYLQSERMGPIPFELKFHPPIPTDSL